jgi:hypothetical protein
MVLTSARNSQSNNSSWQLTIRPTPCQGHYEGAHWHTQSEDCGIFRMKFCYLWLRVTNNYPILESSFWYWMVGSSCVYTMKYYIIIKKNKILSFEARWKLEDTMLNEMSRHRRTSVPCCHSYLSQKSWFHTGREQNSGHQRLGRWVGGVGEADEEVGWLLPKYS